ncbi:flagellar assembly protein FliH [Alteromonas oceanisediminis]|uniref:flagellar assembly protein FliH n=1 Tax=Alteromonas oceanisediminis TaxID=2836180 RepID=UPI001BDAB600|nr:flagellar assembly protein FliH [Alteromonas oceanisediminis]MBT0584920.1 flagellar assembly protein FliH [Alteromonas oceanisediminis]
MSSYSPKKVDSKDAKPWDLPYVESEDDIDEEETNALNKRSEWRYEPPEPEEEILPPTAEEIEAIRQAAFDEGFNNGHQEGLTQGTEEGQAKGYELGHAEGLAQGKEEGLAQGQSEVQALAEQWQVLVDSLQSPLAKRDEQVQEELLQLAVALAKSVIQVEVKTNHGVIEEAFRQALSALPSSEQTVTIKLHPDDIAVIKRVYDDAHIQQQGWQFQPSPELSPGGCDVSTSNNAVDYSIERRCKDVIDTFLLQQGLSRDG